MYIYIYIYIYIWVFLGRPAELSSVIWHVPFIGTELRLRWTSITSRKGKNHAAMTFSPSRRLSATDIPIGQGIWVSQWYYYVYVSLVGTVITHWVIHWSCVRVISDIPIGQTYETKKKNNEWKNMLVNIFSTMDGIEYPQGTIDFACWIQIIPKIALLI